MCRFCSYRHHLKAVIHYSEELCSCNFSPSSHLLTQTSSTHWPLKALKDTYPSHNTSLLTKSDLLCHKGTERSWERLACKSMWLKGGESSLGRTLPLGAFSLLGLLFNFLASNTQWNLEDSVSLFMKNVSHDTAILSSHLLSTYPCVILIFPFFLIFIFLPFFCFFSLPTHHFVGSQ